MKIKLLICVAVTAVVAALAAAFYVSGASKTGVPESDGSLRKVLEAKQLVLGIDSGFPPMSFVGENGEIIGFDIDMAQEICNRLGLTLVKRPINWDTKEDDLNSGVIDCIGSMSVTPASSKEMNLTEPYIKDDLIFVVPGNSSAKWLRDLKGKAIGVQSGSTTQDALEALGIYKEVSVVVLDDNLAILRELKRGTLDAGLVDSLVAYYFIDSSKERFFVLPDSLGEEDCAIGFRKEDRELRDKVQEIISAMKKEGKLSEISKKWFGSDITIVK